MARTTAIERRLAAVFAADVEGYSRLMGADEVGTLRELTARRAILDQAIADHRGRIANTAGDSVLAEFGSAVDAVNCAVEAQAALTEANAGLSPDKQIRFRIGIHVGDVMVRAGDLFGDGVNIAARLQTIAEPGGVCVSGVTYDQVRKVLPVAFTDLGAQQVKNIDEPVRVFVVVPSPAQVGPARLAHQRAHPGQAPDAVGEGQGGGSRGHVTASPQTPAANPSPQGRGALPLPDKPSIAVLPFQNMSGDPEQEYFADGMVEDIITALSRFKSLFVIARNSSFTYKGKAVDIKQVGRELGVRYVLEGSVRKARDRVRITGQLVETSTGNHLWAEKFDGQLEDVFDLQDQITQRVVGTVGPSVERAEIERAMIKGTDSLVAYDWYLRGRAAQWLSGTEHYGTALEYFHRAIELDPTFASAYARAANCIQNRLNNQWGTSDSKQEIADGTRLAGQAVALGQSDAVALSAAAFFFALIKHEVDYAEKLVDQALALNSNLADAWRVRGWLSVWIGRPEDAVGQFEIMIRLDPLDPSLPNAYTGIGAAYNFSGRSEQGVPWLERLFAEKSG